MKPLSLQRPYALHCDFGSGLFFVPLELSSRKKSRLRYANLAPYGTENYRLSRPILENGLASPQVSLDDLMQLNCSKNVNNAYRIWTSMGLAYANPPFSELPNALYKHCA